MPKVSALIASRNNAVFIGQAIRSVLAEPTGILSLSSSSEFDREAIKRQIDETSRLFVSLPPGLAAPERN